MYNDYPIIYETNLDQYIIYYIIIAVIILAVFIFTMISLAKIFKKANRSGISAIIPFYNFLVLLEITNLPKWYFILLLIPGVNIIFEIFIMMELAKLFRKGKIFGLGLTFLPFVFYPLLAFGESEYLGLDLVAMDKKTMVVEVPKIVNDEENPVVNESFDDKNKNINISIGGGVYQKDYTNTLLDLDDKQVIVDKTNDIKTNSVEKSQNNTLNSTFSVENSNNDTSNYESGIESIVNNISYKEENNGIINQQVNNSLLNENNQMIDNQVPEFIDCPQCGAKIKRSAGVCFLCGKKLD